MQPITEPTRERDIEAVASLRLVAFFEGSERSLADDVADLRKLLAGDRFETALIVRVGGVPAGTCLLVRSEREPAHDLTPWLAGLAVAPEHQRRGIGTALARAIEAHAASADVSELYVYTWQARDFYATLGWVAVEEFEQDGAPMLLMSRRPRL
ncbi:GNAT family N-acetyltransferase [Mesorhizobium sp. M0571]|uniref:GNAT family N-acetyltransferase n=1 Tax=Mesorhizobium sp. M0571 TaxID=2956960 RepID=UPI00333DD4A8